MKLTVMERITLMGILPQEGSYVTYKILSNLRQELSFSEKEIRDFEIKEALVGDTGRMNITWEATKAKEKHFELGLQAISIVKTALDKLEKEGKINAQNVSVYEKYFTDLKT